MMGLVPSSRRLSYSSWFYSSLLCFFTIIVIVLCCTATVNALVKLPPNQTVPAVFAFGDSIVDTGNNNNLQTAIKCDFPPYGMDFDGGVPSGRFCDGKVPPDIIAGELGIKATLPAYLDPTLQPQDLVTGVSFASGGAGYDPLTSTSMSVLSLSDQLQNFQEYIRKLRLIVGEDKTNFILASSIFLVVAGSDDIGNNYFLLRARKLQYDAPAYADLMIHFASDFLRGLYGLGARRIAIFSAPPIGCVPFQRTLRGGTQRDCADDENELAKLFNSKLSAELDSLTGSLANGKFVYIDVYNPLLDLIQNPQNYDFGIVDKGCCGTGKLEVTILCNRYAPLTCANVSDYLFWDSYHPTERTYQTLILPLIGKYINEFF